jgi:hypothetical protein
VPATIAHLNPSEILLVTKTIRTVVRVTSRISEGLRCATRSAQAV